MDNKLLIAKMQDKIRICKTQNKVTNSDFLNEQQIELVKKELIHVKENNFLLYGGFEEAIRKTLIFFPEKIEKNEVIKNINNIINVIKIELPNEIKGTLKHKDYLGTIMSFGLARERIGDIIVFDNKAYIIVFNENASYIKNELQQEKKFKKSRITIIKTDQMETKPLEFETITITTNSLRLDSLISELIKTSRKIAQEKIEAEKVIVNYNIETKNTKKLKESDTVVIRGYGKYIIEQILGKNKNGKLKILIKKYV